MPGFLGPQAHFTALYGKALTTAKTSKKDSKEAQAGLLAMDGLHKQVSPPPILTPLSCVGSPHMHLPTRIGQEPACSEQRVQRGPCLDSADLRTLFGICWSRNTPKGIGLTPSMQPWPFVCEACFTVVYLMVCTRFRLIMKLLTCPERASGEKSVCCYKLRHSVRYTAPHLCTNTHSPAHTR